MGGRHKAGHDIVVLREASTAAEELLLAEVAEELFEDAFFVAAGGGRGCACTSVDPHPNPLPIAKQLGEGKALHLVRWVLTQVVAQVQPSQRDFYVPREGKRLRSVCDEAPLTPILSPEGKGGCVLSDEDGWR